MPEPPAPVAATTSTTAIRIGEKHYDIDISKIPYLSSFASFQQKSSLTSEYLVHGPIPLFDIALQGIERGYRQCLRLLPADLSQHQTLCETYDFLRVDVLASQTVDGVIDDLKTCKIEYELKSKARDAAFRFLYLLLLSDLEAEPNVASKVFDATLFVVSHPGTFKIRTRRVVRAAYEERFEVSAKQKARLDQWEKDRSTIDSGDDATTAPEMYGYDYYGSDADDW